MAKLAVQIFKYMLIVLGCILGVAVVGCAVLVVFPSASIFGVSYSSGNNIPATSYYATSNADFTSAQIVEFKTDGYGIRIREKNGDDLVPGDMDYGISIHKKFAGFVYGKVKQPSISVKYNATTNTLTYELAEPVGLINNTDTYIDVFVPNNLFAGKTLKINTAGAEARIGYAQHGQTPATLAIKDALVVGHGATSFYNAAISNTLTVNKTGGAIKVEKDIGKSADIKISGGLSKIDLASVSAAGAATLGLKIDANNAEVNTGNVFNGFHYEGNGGLLRMGNIDGEVVIETQGAEVNIAKITNSLSTIIDGTDGAVKIGEVAGYISVRQTSGSVSIDKALAKADIITTRGNITIKEANDEVNAKTERGKIAVTANEAKSFKITTQNKYGNTVIKNARDIVNASIKDNGPGKIDVEFLRISGASLIKANTGNITITVKQMPLTSFYLEWSSKKANIALGGLETSTKTGGAGVVDGALTDAATNKLTVQANGTISVKQNIS